MTRIALLFAAFLLAGSAEAQRRMPSRTAPIPDTESGRLIIHGPPTPPLGAPQEEASKPKPEAEPETPAPPPVVKPETRPVPPPPPVAIPEPKPVPPPPPIAVPAPKPVPPPAPIAIPAPKPTPPPAPVAVPAPKPVPIVPAAATPSGRQPIVDPAALKPKPEPEQRAAAVPVVPGAVPRPEDKLIENIFACFSPGLPQDWKRAWVVVTDLGIDDKDKKEQKFDAKYYFATSISDSTGETFTPCNTREIALRIFGLRSNLPPERRDWRQAKLTLTNEGNFELQYDYKK